MSRMAFLALSFLFVIIVPLLSYDELKHSFIQTPFFVQLSLTANRAIKFACAIINENQTEKILHLKERSLARNPGHIIMHAEKRNSQGKQWVFGIGISKYVELPNLTNAVKDVKDVINLLTEDYGVSPLNTVTLFDEEANQENLIHQLDKLAEKVGSTDSLLIYFAGHGYLNKTTEMGYWIPSDAKKGKTSLYINNSTIRDYIKAIKSKHTLLIADSCFSGSFFVRGTSRSSVALQELESIPSRWAICSGRHNEEVSDGPLGGNSPFAQSILEALSSNTNQLLNVAKLADRVVEQTRSNFEQLPEGNPIQGVGHKGGQYVFHRKAKEERLWEECQRNNTVRFYSHYLRQFPSGKYRSVALIRIKELEDEAAWKLAEKSNTIYAFYNYIDRDSDGKYVKEAEARIATLENTDRSQPAPEPPSTEWTNPPHIEYSTEEEREGIDTKKEAKSKQEAQHLAQTQNTEQLETKHTEPDQFSGEGYFKEAHTQISPAPEYEQSVSQEKTIPNENSREFSTFNRWLWVAVAIPVFYFTLSYVIVFFTSILFGNSLFLIHLGFLTHQIHGIIFSVKCHRVKFKFGTYFAFLIPPLSYFIFQLSPPFLFGILGRFAWLLPPIAFSVIAYWYLLKRFRNWSAPEY